MTLEHMRQEIDRIDDQLITLLQKRFSLVSDLLKHKKGLTDPAREADILSKTDSPYIQAVYQALFTASKQLLIDTGYKDPDPT